METVTVPENLVSKDDGRKKAWYVKKIEKLESDLAAARNSTFNDRVFADGFIACMHQFQIMNKAARHNIHRQILERGPGITKKFKGSKFRGFTL